MGSTLSTPSEDPLPSVSHPSASPGMPETWSLLRAEIPYLRRAARRWYRDAADVDDLVQDTLIRALASAHLWESGTNLRAWLVTIMRNQFFTTIGKTQRATVAGETLQITGDSAAANEAESRLLLRDVERALRRLPTKQRSAVVLAAVDGTSYNEAASIMGLSVDAVRCHLARARTALRTAVYHPNEPTRLKSR
jgi:RNA polymerase sigma factor (sigma-70 family)